MTYLTIGFVKFAFGLVEDLLENVLDLVDLVLELGVLACLLHGNRRLHQ